jgi:hypothetical protein
MRLVMARTAAIFAGIIGVVWWSGLVEFEEEHLKWFCVPFSAYVIGMVLLFE